MLSFLNEVTSILRNTRGDSSVKLQTDMDVLHSFFSKQKLVGLKTVPPEQAIPQLFESSAEAVLSIILTSSKQEKESLQESLEQFDTEMRGLLNEYIETTINDLMSYLTPEQKDELSNIFQENITAEYALDRVIIKNKLKEFLRSNPELSDDFEEDLQKFRDAQSKELSKIRAIYISKEITSKLLNFSIEEVNEKNYQTFFKSPATQTVFAIKALKFYLTEKEKITNKEEYLEVLLKSLGYLPISKLPEYFSMLEGEVLTKDELDELLDVCDKKNITGVKTLLCNLYCLKDLRFANYADLGEPSFFSRIDLNKALEVIGSHDSFEKNYLLIHLILKNFDHIVHDPDLKNNVCTYLQGCITHNSNPHEQKIASLVLEAIKTNDKQVIYTSGQADLIADITYSHHQNLIKKIDSFKNVPIKKIKFGNALSNEEPGWREQLIETTIVSAKPNAEYLLKDNVLSQLEKMPLNSSDELINLLKEKKISFHARYGRTLVFKSTVDEQLFCIKFKKTHEDFSSLQTEADTNLFLKGLENKGKLQSKIPNPLGLTKEDDFVEQLLALNKTGDDSTQEQLEKEIEQLRNICTFPAECYVYKAHPRYFDYLHQVDLQRGYKDNSNEFIKSVNIITHDLVYLLKNYGLVNDTFMDLQHECNPKYKAVRRDKGRYYMLFPVLNNSLARDALTANESTAGCIENITAAVEFINAALESGLRDNELVHISVPAQRAQDIANPRFTQFNFEMQTHQSLSDYQLALFLVIAKRANNFSQQTFDEAMKEKIWNNAAEQVVYMMATFLHEMTGMPLDLAYAFNKNHAVDVDLLGKQMQFFLDYEYLSYLPDTKQNWDARPDDPRNAKIYDKWKAVYGADVTNFTFNKPSIVGNGNWDEEMGCSATITVADLNSPTAEATKTVPILGTANGNFPILAFERMIYENMRAIQTIQHFQAIGIEKPWKETAVKDSKAAFDELFPEEDAKLRDDKLAAAFSLQRHWRERDFSKHVVEEEVTRELKI